MKILYDYSAFVMQSRGGVSRVLYDLFGHVSRLDMVDCRLFAGFHKNQYLRDAPDEIKHNIIGWYLPKWMVKQRIFMPINRMLFGVYACWFKPQICHLTYFDIPPIPSGSKVVITIHDMIHELFPELFSETDPQREWKKNAIERCDGIICVSKNTESDLRQFHDVSSKQVSVIYHGNSVEAARCIKCKKEYKYLLYVGTRTVKYKNFSLVLEAVKELIPKDDLHLVCFGGGAFTPNEKRDIAQHDLEGYVHQVGGDDETLAEYYEGALALVYPSAYEGFGLPPIEAMGCGCPVISSHAPPMPEIVEEAAVLFNPLDVKSLIEAVQDVLKDEIREKYVKLGLKRVQRFNWDSIAVEVLDCYTSLLTTSK